MPAFSNLRVYHQSRDVLRRVIALSEGFQGFASLKDQIRRSSISVVSNICEGAEHASRREFRRFLGIARASAGELYGQIVIARDCRLVPAAVGDQLTRDIDYLACCLGAFIRRIEADTGG